MNSFHFSLIASLALHGVAGALPHRLPDAASSSPTVLLQARLQPPAREAASVNSPRPTAVQPAGETRKAPSPLSPPSEVLAVAPAPAPRAVPMTAVGAADETPPTVVKDPHVALSGPELPSAAAAVSAPVRVDATIVPPVPVAYADNPPPVYPRFSKARGEVGRVVLAVKVGSDGRPLQVALQSSSGFPALDKAAHQAVERWRFVPGTRDGQAIDATVQVPIVFNLATRSS